MSARPLQGQTYAYNPQTYVVEKHMSKLEKAALILTHPKRKSYDEAEFNKFGMQREEEIVQYDGKKMRLSIFSQGTKTEKILLFLHSHAGSKKEGMPILKYLPWNLSMAMFDFLGTGNNQQADHVTLGFDEAKQAGTVINFLKRKSYEVYIWGFFTGAVAALLCGQGNVIVADCSFTTFEEYLQQRSQYHRKFCCCFNVCWFGYLFKKVRSKINKMAGYDVKQLDTRSAVKNLDPITFLLLISRNQDQIMSRKHAQQLYELFPGKKKALRIYQGPPTPQEWDILIKEIICIIMEETQGEGEDIKLRKKRSNFL